MRRFVWLSVLAAAVPAAALLSGSCSKSDDPAANKARSQGMHDSGLDAPPPDAGNATGPDGQKLPPPAFRFEDGSAGSGINAMNHSGRPGVKEYLVEGVGVGPAWLDYDHDGLMDLYIPDGDVFSNYTIEKTTDPDNPGKLRPILRRKSTTEEAFHDHLYHNLGGGRFEDVAEKAGVADERWSFGALAFDYNGDGWTDLYVCNMGKNRLYRNNGNGTFTDVAEQLGVAGDENSWSTCATCGDFDNDGRLDLYVAHYADIAAEVDRQMVNRNTPPGTPVEAIRGRSCVWRNLEVYCGPVGLVAQPDNLYRQMEDGTFRDVSVESGIRAKPPKYGFTSFFFDYDGDGLLDIYVANDSEENMLWHQEAARVDGKVHFTDVADPLGVKFGPSQNGQASMGACIADINQDGLIDIFVTNFSHDYNNIFVGHKYPSGAITFRDRGQQVMGGAVFYDLSWGCGWYDFDLDGDLDLFIANGHVYKENDLFPKTGTSYDQYPAVFECLNAAKLGYREVGSKLKDKPPPGLTYADVFAGKGLEIKKCCRGAGFCDWDNDGDTDVVVCPMNDVPIVLRNDLEHGPGRHWLKLITRQPGKNVEAIGAMVRVMTPGGPTQMFPVYRCQSLCGTDDPRIPVGLGKADSATVTVTWPGTEKEVSTYPDLAADGIYILNRGGKAERVK